MIEEVNKARLDQLTTINSVIITRQLYLFGHVHRRRSLLGRAGSGRPLFSPCGQGVFLARPLFDVQKDVFVACSSRASVPLLQHSCQPTAEETNVNHTISNGARSP